MFKIFTAIGPETAKKNFESLVKEYCNIDKKIETFNKIFFKMKKTEREREKLDKDIKDFMKEHSSDVKKYLNNLSTLNYRSGSQIPEIFKKLRDVRSFLQIIQTGDHFSIFPTSHLLSSQVNTSRAKLLGTLRKNLGSTRVINETDSRGKKRKKKIETNKKKLRKQITQKLKAKSKLKKVKTRSKPKK
jgi:septal ring factor EnvC (AmiA/AmiB activator)